MFKRLFPKNVRLFNRGETVSPRKRLSIREAEIADYLAEGLSPVLISSSLGISPKATKRYLKSIRRKLWIRGEIGEALWRLGFGKKKNYWGRKGNMERRS